MASVTPPVESLDPGTRHYVHPGQMVVTRGDAVITMVLGSCVAVCLRDEKSGITGAIHYVLPEGPGAEKDVLRFGTLAIPALIRRLCGVGASEKGMSAKIFGGAAINAPSNAAGDHVGHRNVRVARGVLAARQIEILREDVGGARGRKLTYVVLDGTDTVKLLGT